MKRTISGGGATQGFKKGRGDDDEDGGMGGSSFEDELMMMDEMLYESIDPEAACTQDEQEHKWSRAPEPLDPSTDPLGMQYAHNFFLLIQFFAFIKNLQIAFQWLDIDMTSGNPMESNPAGGSILGSR